MARAGSDLLFRSRRLADLQKASGRTTMPFQRELPARLL
jgi:hypothetical protein